MNKAEWYIEQRINHPSTPSAWSRYGPEIEADPFDLLTFKGAIFHKDGKTVTLSDGSKMRKVLSRKTPWKSLG